MRQTPRESPSCPFSPVLLRPETAAPLNKTLQSVDATQDAMETLTLDNNLYDEEDDVEDVNDLDDGDEDDIGDLDGSSATTDELDSNASLCSEDFGVEGESKNAENQKSRNLPHINDVGSNTSNAIKEVHCVFSQRLPKYFIQYFKLNKCAVYHKSI